MRQQTHYWHKPCSVRIHLTVHCVDGDDGLITCACLVQRHTSTQYRESSRRFENKRDKSQECQVVVMEVVTVALSQSKSASDDLMEPLFDPTLNRNSAEVCAVRQMRVYGQRTKAVGNRRDVILDLRHQLLGCESWIHVELPIVVSVIDGFRRV